MTKQYNNLLMSRMERGDRDAIQPFLVQVDLVQKQVIDLAGKLVEFAYFIEEGTVSSFPFVARPSAGEIAVCGYEGMTGTSVLLGDRHASSTCVVETSTVAYRIAANDLLEVLRSRPSLAAFLMRFAGVRQIQVASTAAANAQGSLEQRVARRLLMALDRSGCRRLPFTHDDLSLITATSRPSITNAIHRLEGERLVRATRGTVEVVDRARLEILAGSLYGSAEGAYLRLFGVDFRLCLQTSPLAP